MRDFERKNVYGCRYVFSIHVVSQKLYPLFFPSNVQLNETAKVFRHLEKQETEMKWKRKLEMETGNGNGTIYAPITSAMFSL